MAKLGDYIIRRLLLLIPVMLGVSMITFGLAHVIPGDVARAYCGQKCDEARVEAIRERLNLNEPLWKQYMIYMEDLLHGDLGFSLIRNEPVADALWRAFPATLELTMAAMFIVTVGGIFTGVLSATNQDKILDHVTRFVAITGVSMPIFWLALMLQWALGFHLDLVPILGRLDAGMPRPPDVTGMYTVDSALAGDWHTFRNAVWHLLLPAFTLAYGGMGIILRMTRSSLLEVLNEDYIRTARAKGLSERVVIYKHALRNALIPTVTVLGLSFGGLLGGAVLTETIFAWPGMGSYAVAAVLNLDYAGIMGFTLLVAVIYVLANLIVDIMYAFLDPRIRLG